VILFAALLIFVGVPSSRAQSTSDSRLSQKPMAPDADPVFEVASIKLSPSG
jgi:hypothetical protein